MSRITPGLNQRPMQTPVMIQLTMLTVTKVSAEKRSVRLTRFTDRLAVGCERWESNTAPGVLLRQLEEHSCQLLRR